MIFCQCYLKYFPLFTCVEDFLVLIVSIVTVILNVFVWLVNRFIVFSWNDHNSIINAGKFMSSILWTWKYQTNRLLSISFEIPPSIPMRWKFPHFLFSLFASILTVILNVSALIVNKCKSFLVEMIIRLHFWPFNFLYFFSINFLIRIAFF